MTYTVLSRTLINPADATGTCCTKYKDSVFQVWCLSSPLHSTQRLPWKAYIIPVYKNTTKIHLPSTALQRVNSSQMCRKWVTSFLFPMCWFWSWFGASQKTFLQCAQCSHCKRCISYGNSVRLSVRPSVRPSVCLSHTGIVSKRRHVARCSFHRWITKCV